MLFSYKHRFYELCIIWYTGSPPPEFEIGRVPSTFISFISELALSVIEIGAVTQVTRVELTKYKERKQKIEKIHSTLIFANKINHI